MGKIYYIMGKSASGKDTLYAKMLDECPKMRKITLYTTRPIREGETDGVEYHFVTPEDIERFKEEGRLIESRTYDTVYGPWTYATVDDGSVKLDKRNYVAIGTLESYGHIKDYYGEENVRPIFIEIDPGIRIQRALNREMMQPEPKYAEMCRRFLADEEDFSEDNIYAAGIRKRYINDDVKRCFAEIIDDMDKDAVKK